MVIVGPPKITKMRDPNLKILGSGVNMSLHTNMSSDETRFCISFCQIIQTRVITVHVIFA